MATLSVPSISLRRPHRSLAASPSPKPFPAPLSPARRRRRSPQAIRPAPAAASASAAGGSSPSAAPSSGFDSAAVDDLGGVAISAASTGEPVFIRDLWDQNEGMAVVALLRHFGCPCCWELASVLRDSKSRFDSAGVKLIAIGVGTPDKARILAERLPFPLDCLYADPDRKAYDVLGLYYGLARTFFNPASAKVFSRFESLKNAVKNYTIEATPENRASVLQQNLCDSFLLHCKQKLQIEASAFGAHKLISASHGNKRLRPRLGGMFVFKGKELLYARKDEGTGDHAPLDEVLDICCKVPVA